MSNVVKIEIPVEELIEGVKGQLNKSWLFEKWCMNIDLATEFAVEDNIYKYCEARKEYTEPRAMAKITGDYFSAPEMFVIRMGRGFAQLANELKDNVKPFDPKQEATKEVIEKVIRPIGEKVVAEVCVDNAFKPEVLKVYAIK
jgi:hypothetical protein